MSKKFSPVLVSVVVALVAVVLCVFCARKAKNAGEAYMYSNVERYFEGVHVTKLELRLF